MRKIAAIAALLISTGAYAADPEVKKALVEPPPAEKPLVAWPELNADVLGSGFDYAYGVKFQSDYLSRGVTQTAHRPSGTAYGELRYGWFYAGLQPWNVQLPTYPTMELDLYGGIRPTWGALTFDVGVIYYAYLNNKTRWYLAGQEGPVLNYYSQGGTPTVPANFSYWEFYTRPSWAINDWLTLGYSLYFAPNWANWGGYEFYNEVNAKLTIPDTGVSISGAFGRMSVGYSSPEYGYSYVDPRQYYFPTYTRGSKFASYNTWNVGASYNYKVMTFDVRYYSTSLKPAGCFLNTSDPAGNWQGATLGVGTSSWCGSRVVAGMSLDFNSSTFKSVASDD